MGRATVIVFLKAPQIGMVKTRLARSIGETNALITYKSLAVGQLARLGAAFQVEIHFSPAECRGLMKDWLGPDYNYYPQSEGDLGERLKQAIQAAATRNDGPVVCIGGDCPSLGARQIAAAIELTTSGTDLVLGPSEDGGYYLIGLRAPEVELFRDIPWSSPETMTMTLRRARELALQIVQLETLYDVDELKDLERAVEEGVLPENLLH